MSSVCFYFQVHQPFRLRQDYSFFHIGINHFYEDDAKNKAIAKKIAEKCYLPTNKLMLDLIKKHGDKFKVCYSLSGMAIEQFERYTPEVLESFQALVDTGNVELLAETYYHSLASQFSVTEFREQVKLHVNKMKTLFGQTPTVFRNTELIYNNDVAAEVEKMGFTGILAEGADKVLMWRSPNFVYASKSAAKLKMLLKNYRLSDDIAFRFSNAAWENYPLTAEKYAGWLANAAQQGDVINLFMDYETFGEHQWEQTGIFNFLWHLPDEVLARGMDFATPSEVIAKYAVRDKLDVPHCVSWADTERDLSAWLGNHLQNSSVGFVYSLEKLVHEMNDPDLLQVWRKLQTSDHFYYMSTKKAGDGDVHNYFNPYNSPYDAFVLYNNVLSDLKLTLESRNVKTDAVQAAPAVEKPKKRAPRKKAPESTLPG
jgi:alpha-amylase